MNEKKTIDCEQSKIERWSQFQIKHHWKLKGVVVCLVMFLAMITLKFTDTEPQWLNAVLRRGLLIGLLIIVLSKEKMEDEMIVSLRAKAFALAFVFAVVYALVQPLIDHIVFYIFNGRSTENEFSYFQVLFFMMVIQIMFFNVLKRNR